MKKLTFIIISLLLCSQLSAQEGDFANVNGVNIYYEIHGEGKPLVLLHGFTWSHEMWDGWIDEFSKNYKLIIPDLRGHGLSTNPSKKYTHKEVAKDIDGLLDLLNITKCNAIGVSSGSMVLTHMAIMNTSKIESMILIASTSYYPESCRNIQRSISYEGIDEEWRNSLLKLHPGGETQVRSLLNQFRKMADSYDDMNFTSPYLSTIKCQTLIIHGDNDPFFPADIALNSHNSMPNSFLWIIPNFGHSSIDRNSIWGDPFLKVTNQFFHGDWIKTQ